MYKIQANTSGARNIEITDNHPETVKKYSLLSGLVDSNGIIDENILNELRFNVRKLLESEPGKDKDLLDLCLGVIYNQNMKAIGLKNLVTLFKEQILIHQDAEEGNSEVL